MVLFHHLPTGAWAVAFLYHENSNKRNQPIEVKRKQHYP